MTDDTLISCWC